MTSSIKKTSRALVIIAIVILVSIFLVQSQIAPPSDFPVPYRLTVTKGQTLFGISHELALAHVITSARMFEVFMIVLGSEKKVSEGDYYFKSSATTLQVALRISGHQFGIERQKITFPEGFSTTEMANRLTETFPDFDLQLFLELAKGKEGYLFPDTYKFFPSITPDTVLVALEQNFHKKIDPLEGDIVVSGQTEKDIIIMASIVEKEASGPEDRSIIAGILWNRLKKGISLQVDAPFLYILNKDNQHLTKADLATNSPYNTYMHTGLPPTPIGNPGLAAIVASIHPTQSLYLFYLHDNNRGIHYAQTYAEHQANIRKYLK